MHPFSTSEWEQVGTNEPDTRHEDGMASMSPARTGYIPWVHPDYQQPSTAPLGPMPDPQPWNPSYQLQTGMTDWINIQALGADPTGVADSLGIFQAADLIAQIPPKRMIYIPAGTWKLSANMTFTAGSRWLNMGTVTGGTLSGGQQIQFGQTSGTGGPVNVLSYGADPTGVADSTAAVNAAIAAMPLAGSPGVGGTLYFPAGTYKITSTISITAVAPVYILGDGPQVSQINYFGTGDCISLTQAYLPSGGSASIKVWGSGVRGLTIDGTNAGAGAKGLHTGDMKYGHIERVQIQHFNTAGGIGLWIDNRNFWTEDTFFEVHSQDNTTLFQIDATGSVGAGTAATAHDNCFYYFSCAALPNQDALHITNGANLYHSRIWLHGGMKSSATPVTSAAIRIDDGTSVPHSSANRCELVVQLESDGGQANTPQTIVTSVAGNTINSAWGRLAWTNAYSAASIAGGFSFNGPISGDATLTAQIPSGVPANGVVNTNTKCPAVMCVSGGTVSAVKIGGITTGLIAGAFPVPSNQTYEIDWTGSPTVNWYPMASG